MRFLADESVIAEVIFELRKLGHDVFAVIEQMKSAADPVVLNRAFADGRILITEDKDFGDLVVRQGLGVDGVVLLALRKMSPSSTTKRVIDAIIVDLDKLAGRFTVIEPGRTRSRPI